MDDCCPMYSPRETSRVLRGILPQAGNLCEATDDSLCMNSEVVWDYNGLPQWLSW